MPLEWTGEYFAVFLLYSNHNCSCPSSTAQTGAEATQAGIFQLGIGIYLVVELVMTRPTPFLGMASIATNSISVQPYLFSISLVTSQVPLSSVYFIV